MTTTHCEELKERIASNPDAVVQFLYETYSVLKTVTRSGDWDAAYYPEADDLWQRLGEWMYP